MTPSSPALSRRGPQSHAGQHTKTATWMPRSVNGSSVVCEQPLRPSLSASGSEAMPGQKEGNEHLLFSTLGGTRFLSGPLGSEQQLYTRNKQADGSGGIAGRAQKNSLFSVGIRGPFLSK